jgi:tRNA-specific 2-thiouridylase
MAHIVVAMSGGVDSSVAAALLLEQGHRVTGVFMRHGQADVAVPVGGRPRCCSAADADDARRVADRLGIAFYALDFQREFARVVDYFVDEYTAGRTPNPCIACNSWLKFGRLFDYADSIEADAVATGHYARIATDDAGQSMLLRGVDPAKDQSYVLYGIPRERLGRVRLPVGEFQKDTIRRMATERGLPVAEKPESQDICFVPDGDHATLVRRRRAERAGPDAELSTAGEIVTTDGRVVGRHDGFERFTIGQRKGLGVALGEPYFVVRIEPRTRRVVLGRHEELARSELVITDTNWLIPRPREPLSCDVKVRYRSSASGSRVVPLSGDKAKAFPRKPLFGVASGQSAVLYSGDHVLGGGVIS